MACSWFALSLQPLPAANPVHAPYLQNLQADHVTIVWSAKENQVGTVRYSTDGSFSQSVTAQRVRPFLPDATGKTGMSGIAFYQYQADLTGLAPGADYVYRVFVGSDNITPESGYKFRTPAPGPFSFLVMGDSGDGSSRQNAVTQQIVKEQPDFLVHVGDIAYQSGTFDEFYANYFLYYATLMRRACFFAIAGNHEYYTLTSSPYLALHAPPSDGVPPADRGRYYSFDWANVHFVGLDANLLDPGFPAQKARMLAWMDNDLANTSAPWKIVFWHQTPYPISHHLNDGDPIDISARLDFVPILERHGVQVVITGHEHNYTRSKPMRGGTPVSSGPATVYITSGGGGGALHDVSPQPFLDQQFSVNHYLRVEVDGPQMTVHMNGTTDGRTFSEMDQVTLKLPALAGGTPVVNGASFLPPLAPGALVSIFGQSLASTTGQASSVPLPTSLAGTSVTLNGVPLALFYASPNQVNAALPLNALGPATLRVSTSTGFDEARVNIGDSAPAIFPFAITHVNGSLVSATAPATPGETLVIYMTGLGQVDGPIAAGQAAPSSPLLHVLAPVQVDFGDNVPIVPSFAGLAPGFVGVYQVNVAVPANLTPKVYPLRVSVKGNPCNPQNIPVQNRAIP